MGEENLRLVFQTKISPVDKDAVGHQWGRNTKEETFLVHWVNSSNSEEHSLHWSLHFQGVPQDYSTAVKWYSLAAEQGDADAQTNLGVMYANGEGVLQDNVYAHM